MMDAERKVTTYGAQRAYSVSLFNDFSLELLRQSLFNKVVFEARQDLLMGNG